MSEIYSIPPISASRLRYARLGTATPRRRYESQSAWPLPEVDMPDTLTEHRYDSTSRTNTLMQLANRGQSCWLDDLTRRMLRNGELAELVEKGVRGVTANPATFAKAIIGGREYDSDIDH